MIRQKGQDAKRVLDARASFCIINGGRGNRVLASCADTEALYEC